MRKAGLYFFVLVLSLFLFSVPTFAFQPLRSDTGASVHWEKNPVIYLLNQKGTNSPCVSDVRASFENAFSVWTSVSTMALQVQYGGTTSVHNYCGLDENGTGCDATNVIGFVGGGNFPAGVLAATVNYYRISTGEIKGTDMAFNDSLNWSDDPISHPNLACRGYAFYSLPAVAVHEVGHFLGLDHSFCTDVGSTFVPSVASSMYPFYFGNEFWTDAVSLSQDDIAGISWLYPSIDLLEITDWGKIKGTVKYTNGIGLFGVQVTAIRASDKVPIVTTFTRNGKYTLYGLPPDDYYVYANTPRIGGTLFTAFMSDYWRGPDKVPYILLYKQIKVKKKSALGSDGTVFTKPGAKIITVPANTTISKVNFVYPVP